MLLYPLAYALIWSLPTGIRIYQATTARPAPWQLQTVDKMCVVMQGLVDAIIYGATEGSLSSWRNLFFGSTRRPISTVGVCVGDSSGTNGGAKRRGSSYWPTGAAEQQLTRPSTGDGDEDEEMAPGADDDASTVRRRSAGSVSLGSSTLNFKARATVLAAGSAPNCEGMIQLGNLQQQGRDGNGPGHPVPTMRIRKTVEIDVSKSESAVQEDRDGPQVVSYQKPPKAHLPFSRNMNSGGSFLNM